MNRGDLITVALSGDFGKPRPALVIQSDFFSNIETVTVLLLSSTIVDAPLLRLAIEPDASNGLKTNSQVMIDKPMTVRREKVGAVIGVFDAETMISVNRLLALFLGLA